MFYANGILNPTHLEAPHYSTPASTYNKLMMSSTRLHPERQSYVTHRMVNEVQGTSRRKEWTAVDQGVKQHSQTKKTVGKETCAALRQQALNIECGNLYV